jgi:hypothetical protein
MESNTMKKLLAVFLSLVLVMFAVPASASNINTPVSSVSLSYTVGESLTLTVTSGPTAAFTLAGGIPTSTPITVSTAWNVANTRTELFIVTYLSSTTAALAGGGVSIPSSDVFASDNGNPSVACTKSAPNGLGIAGAGCSPDGSNGAFSLPLTSASNNFTGTQNDSWVLTLQNLPANLPAGTYAGTINFVAMIQ